MKHYFAVVVVLLFSYSLPATEKPKFDGYWWGGMSEQAKSVCSHFGHAVSSATSGLWFYWYHHFDVLSYCAHAFNLAHRWRSRFEPTVG